MKKQFQSLPVLLTTALIWGLAAPIDDGSLVTAYALTAYLKQPPDMFVTETVRWRLP